MSGAVSIVELMKTESLEDNKYDNGHNFISPTRQVQRKKKFLKACNDFLAVVACANNARFSVPGPEI